MNADLKLVSVVIPAYNEEACVDELARRLQGVFATNEKYDFEVIIVENGSVDATWEKLLPYLTTCSFSDRPEGGFRAHEGHTGAGRSFNHRTKSVGGGVPSRLRSLVAH